MSTGDFASLYTSGDLILQNPIESSSIFLIVVVVCASIEYLFALGEEIDSKFFREMFSTMSEEVLVIGVLSLMLTFGSSVIPTLPLQWAVMFDWAHICLLFMGLMLVGLICLVSLNVFSHNKAWAKFETNKITYSGDTHSSREQRFKMAYEKFHIALKAHGYGTDIPFAEYVLRGEKRNLIALGNLSWKSWLALSTIVVLNAMRTRAVPQHPSQTDPNDLLNETDNLINIAMYIGVCGYGTLALFLAIHLRLQLRFRQYLMLTTGGNEGQRPGGLDEPLAPTINDLDDPQSFLLWQSETQSMAMVQAVLMFLVWYMAVFGLNMMYRTFTFNVGFTILILGAAIAPLVTFLAMVPWTLTTIAILSSLGTSLNEEWVKSIIAAHRASAAANAPEASVNKDVEGLANELKRAEATGRVERRPLRPVVLDETSFNRLAQSYREDRERSNNFEL